ncbi:arginase family protein [Hungatella hathewayi]|uniref:arginase family protein n=1 Tax=Hungatella hathewayi TaxID=154046 RepID=UPI001DA63525|nr:arginase family protein [Hungatella hathewayi]MBS6755796.1 arginase family protein [Hungatella hathewayi]
MKSVSVLNFSGVYERQSFYKDRDCEWIDCSDLSGVNGFCDETSMEEIDARISGLEGWIHFIDGGNFHYLSYLLMKHIREPFTLVVFDHHTDMKPSMFAGLLSCGCWIKEALDALPFLKNVVLIGVADSLADTAEPDYAGRVRIISESMAEAGDTWLGILEAEASEAVYLSIDKDAFGREEVVTDWDQGTMTLELLERAYRILDSRRILGVDICGEADRDEFFLGQMSASDEQNDAANRRILRMLLTDQKKPAGRIQKGERDGRSTDIFEDGHQASDPAADH